MELVYGEQETLAGDSQEGHGCMGTWYWTAVPGLGVVF